MLNWLFARRLDGLFLVRFEEAEGTDAEDCREQVREALDWLGIVPDEEPAHRPDDGPALSIVPLPDLSDPELPEDVLLFREEGYLPEAVLNGLALLGWSPDEGEEVLSRDEMVEAFSAEGIGATESRYDPETFLWLNVQHLRRLSPEELATRARPLLEIRLCWKDRFEEGGERRGWLLDLMALLREGAETLWDLAEGAVPFVFEAISYEAEAVQAQLLPFEAAAPRVRNLRAALDEVGEWTAEGVGEALPGEAASDLLRVALLGRLEGPDVLESAALLGREQTLGRIDTLLRFLDRSPNPPGPGGLIPPSQIR